MIELAETAGYLDALYGGCNPDDGSIVIVAPSRKQLLSVHSVGSQDALMAVAHAMHGNRDLYIKVNLMDAHAMRERSRRDHKGRYITGNKSEVKTIVSFHLDCDASGKSEKYLSRNEILDCLDAMPHRPTLIVNSDGDDGGLHSYWLLKEPHRIVDEDDREWIMATALRWQNRLRELASGKLDSTANIDRVLRVVGGTRSNGHRVTCHEYHPDRLYTLEDLRIAPSQAEIERSVAKEVKQFTKDTLNGSCDLSDPPITAYINFAHINPTSLLRDSLYIKISSDGKEWLRPGSETGARTLKLSDKHEGINVFSGGDPNFDCLDDTGQPGRFYSTAAMFVAFRFSHDWEAAAKWCGEELAKRLYKGKAG